MKKVFAFSLLISFSFFLIACGNNGYEESVKIKLKADPASGYIWEYEVTEQGIVKVNEDSKISCDDESNTCDGYQIYTLEGLQEGEITLTFNYVSGENSLPSVTAKYVIIVNKDLKINETHSGSYFER